MKPCAEVTVFFPGILTKEPLEQPLFAYRVIVGFVGRYVLIFLVYTLIIVQTVHINLWAIVLFLFFAEIANLCAQLGRFG